MPNGIEKHMDLNTKLHEIFLNTNDWLKFAEAKTATLLAGNGVLIFGILRILKDEKYGQTIELYSIFVIVQLILSLVICLIAFIPSLEMPWLFKKHLRAENENLIYFEHIACHTPTSYIVAVSESIDKKEATYTNYDVMLSGQIITNSVITVKKYKFFKIAIWLTLSAIVTPLIVLVLYELK